MKINNKEYYEIILLGKGKSGYSYLVESGCKQKFVAKKIHHQPCDYYQFGDKLKAEINDYNRLVKLISMPRLIEVDYENEIILKEYIDGMTIQQLIDNNKNIECYIEQIKVLADICRKNNLNIDYYPTNFVVRDGQIIYIDYECNEFDEKWSLENWGLKYWRK